MKVVRSLLVTLAGLAAPGLAEAAVGDTSVARWKDNKTATFLLMFDDSWPSHYQMALPALTSRGMTGTFYITPAKGEYLATKSHWETEMWQAGMVYGNHTMTHNGITSADDAEYEVGGCTNEIKRIVPGKARRLISWATPGVAAGQWTITQSELQALWTKYDLIDRPTFDGHGAVYHMQEPSQMLALADSAIGKGGMEYLIFHGIERREPYTWGYQDYWAYNFDKFNAVLDGLQDRRDAGDLWITDHISYYQYMKERDSAALSILSASDEQIALSLTSTMDAELYDEALTLVTAVPTSWTEALVTQGASSLRVPVASGSIQFDAVPNAGTIDIVPVPEPTGLALVAGALAVVGLRRRKA